MIHPSDAVLPFRLRQSTFRLYENFILKAIRESPLTININPAPLRPSTFAARLRDAMLSFHKFKWQASFSAMEFDDAYSTGNLTVVHSENSVSIGPRALRKSGQAPGQSMAFNNPNDKRLDGIFIDTELNEMELQAFCLLLSNKRISGPVILRAQTISEDAVSSLEAIYDIAITLNDQGHSIII